MFRRVAEPRFVGDQTGLSPILSLVGIYVGMKVAGVAGMILGPILILVVLNLVGLGIFQGLLDGCDGGGPGHHGDPFPSGRSGNERVCQTFSGIVQKIPLFLHAFFIFRPYPYFCQKGKERRSPGHSSNRQGVFEMANQDNEFNFYNSENDGYRGGFGGYTDSNPNQSQGGPEAPQGPQKHRGSGRRIAALILACAVVGGGAGVGGAALYSSVFASQPSVIYQNTQPISTQADPVASSSGQAMTPEQLYAANVDACVGITVSTTMTNIFGYTSTSAASGSGFVITADGYIVTNYHVIEDAVKDSSVSITVSFHDGSSYPATLVRGEEDNDVAVLKIEASGLQTVTLGDSDQLKVGQAVMAIGNPLGELTYSLTDGLISALDRLITTGSGNDSTTMNVLQTNCAINPGNSGGPLFNSYGGGHRHHHRQIQHLQLRHQCGGSGLRHPHQRCEEHHLRPDPVRLCYRKALHGHYRRDHVGFCSAAVRRHQRGAGCLCGHSGGRLLLRQGGTAAWGHHHRHG